MNSSTARLGMFQFFENQRSCSFTDHKSVAIAIEGLRSAFGSIISCAGREQSTKNGGFKTAELVGTPDYHHVPHPVADTRRAIPEIAAARGASKLGWNEF